VTITTCIRECCEMQGVAAKGGRRVRPSNNTMVQRSTRTPTEMSGGYRSLVRDAYKPIALARNQGKLTRGLPTTLWFWDQLGL
jgi:hypothetical protein